MDREESIRDEALKRTHTWWYCDNIIDHPEQVALLHMGFPRIFILMRNYDVAYWADFDKWRNDLVEIIFLDPRDKDNTTDKKLTELLIDGWNFLSLEEEEEERQAAIYEEEDLLEEI